MKKVCHLTSAHGKEDDRIFLKECISLAQNGYDVYLVERGNTYDKNGVHIIGLGKIPERRLKRMTEGVKRAYLKAVSINADIYHIHDPELLPIALKLKKNNKKVIFDSHEDVPAQVFLEHVEGLGLLHEGGKFRRVVRVRQLEEEAVIVGPDVPDIEVTG